MAVETQELHIHDCGSAGAPLGKWNKGVTVEFPVRNMSAAQVANSPAKIFIYLLLPLLFR